LKQNLMAYITIALGIIALFLQPFMERQIGTPAFLAKKENHVTVIIDPGHGGEDGGATGVAGTLEKGINLNISRKLRYILEFYGVNTAMTRDSDASIHDEGNSIRKRKISDMKNRVKIVEKTDNPVLLSVHLNFFPKPDCYGAQVFYSPFDPESKILAEYVQLSFKTGTNDDNSRAVKKAEKSIYLLNHVNCPAILAECGFLSNPNEEALLITDEYQTRLAGCIAAGYLQFSVKEQDDGR